MALKRSKSFSAIDPADALRVGAIQGIRRLLRRYGADPAQTLACFDIDADLLDDADQHVSYSRLIELLEWGAETFEADFFGIELAQLQSAQNLGPIALIMENAVTIADGLNLVVRYIGFHGRAIISTLNVCEETAELGYDLRIAALRNKRQVNELSMGVGLHILRAFCGPNFHPEKVVLACKPPGCDLSFPRKFFGCDIEYNGEASVLVFDKRVLQRTIDKANAALHPILQAHLDGLIAQHPNSVTDRVRQAIRDLLPLGQARLSTIGRYVGLHPRLVQMALKDEGFEFRLLLESERRALACSYLADTGTPVAEIAYLLGYADQTSFTRAFRVWEGMPPARYRKSWIAPR